MTLKPCSRSRGRRKRSRRTGRLSTHSRRASGRAGRSSSRARGSDGTFTTALHSPPANPTTATSSSARSRCALVQTLKASVELTKGCRKDIVTRFAHSDGNFVERRFGWDCHGLPVEHEIDKKLGIGSKQDVLDLGIERYNAECRAIVMRYSADWRATVERMGRWIDFDDDYKTLNVTFMESVWWVFRQLWEKGLVYRASRVMPYSTACTTPLSNFEAGSDYRDVNDPAVTVAFHLVDDPDTSLLAWTTTPWTLPSNLALCVHPDLTYLKIFDEQHQRNFILCDKLLGTLYKDPKKAKFKKVGTYRGKELEGWRYTPLFPYFVDEYGQKAFRVVVDTYVTADSGTGIVHQAPAFGADDHEIAKREGIVPVDVIPPCPVDDGGRFTPVVTDFAGQHVKVRPFHFLERRVRRADEGWREASGSQHHEAAQATREPHRPEPDQALVPFLLAVRHPTFSPFPSSLRYADVGPGAARR